MLCIGISDRALDRSLAVYSDVNNAISHTECHQAGATAAGSRPSPTCEQCLGTYVSAYLSLGLGPEHSSLDKSCDKLVHPRVQHPCSAGAHNHLRELTGKALASSTRATPVPKGTNFAVPCTVYCMPLSATTTDHKRAA